MSKESVVASASKLFLKRGCKSVTMDDIAAENGISKRTLYEMFPDKASLLEAAIKFGGEESKKAMADIYMDAPNILEFLLMMHDYHSENMISMYDSFFNEVRKFFPDLYNKLILEMIDEQVEMTKGMIAQGQLEGVFRKDVNAKLTAMMLTQMIQTLKMTNFFENQSLSSKEIIRETIIIYFRGFSTPKGIEIIDRFMDNYRKGVPYYNRVKNN